MHTFLSRGFKLDQACARQYVQRRREGGSYDRRLSRSAAMRPRFGLTAPVASSRHFGHWIVPSALRSAATHVRQISCAPEHGRTMGAWTLVS